ncbi:molybdate ABC transporter substrate-binding protein [Fulvimarina endophytica]|uniref:Molybdate ABC transporter substrate-binding protein n=1 Tax=Fulvimarina endophytica TaxID=2293836 RepID=A0A371X5R7_9HYPH|nr:molybdate ABC transporter substrate-binding protein [Fulvimarina endophytica]
MPRFSFRTAAPIAALLAIGLAIGVPRATGAEEITVFAAASLTNAMADIEARYEATTGDAVTVSLAGSSALARQIIEGAPADIFISANSEWMDEVERVGLVEEGTRVDLLRNELVLIAHGLRAPAVEIGPDMDLAALLGDGKLAMALTNAVPAGIYGKEALESLGQWSAVEDKVVQSDNVRTALRLVAAGEAPYGIVYASDARAEPDVTVVGTFPEDSHQPIIYPAAGLKGEDRPAVDRFLEFLKGPEAKAAFERQGFQTLAE